MDTRFGQLVQSLSAEPCLSSSMEELAMRQPYQQIIGMGIDVLPLIMSFFDTSHEHWFWALRAITGKNPVKAEHVGNVKAMKEDWWQWWRGFKKDVPAIIRRRHQNGLNRLEKEELNQAIEGWQKETRHHSNLRHVVCNQHYQRMIGFGEPAVPHLLERLATGDLNHYFPALYIITGSNPIPEEHAGVMAKMAEAWVEWGRTRGYLRHIKQK